MFERIRPETPPNNGPASQPPSRPAAGPGGYDDGYDAGQRGAAPLPPSQITEEAALALAVDTREYRPWTLQRGRSHPAMMLHLRRFEPKSGFWLGWQVSYPHLVAVEYTGDTMLSLDFGARQFVLAGQGLTELVAHLQTGTVLTVTEFSDRIWRMVAPEGGRITSIRCLGQGAKA
jgi:hypothetical protein